MDRKISCKVSNLEIVEVTGSEKGWLVYVAKVWIQWGDNESSSDNFQIRHIAYFNNGKFSLPPDCDDDIFAHNLRKGLGILSRVFKHDIEEQILVALQQKWNKTEQLSSPNRLSS
jgi:hypothetical protein